MENFSAVVSGDSIELIIQDSSLRGILIQTNCDVKTRIREECFSQLDRRNGLRHYCETCFKRKLIGLLAFRLNIKSVRESNYKECQYQHVSTQKFKLCLSRFEILLSSNANINLFQKIFNMKFQVLPLPQRKPPGRRAKTNSTRFLLPSLSFP